MKFFGIIILLCLPICLSAQQSQTDPEKEEKQMRTAIDSQIETFTRTLKLEDWQVFYLDSIMTHDYTAMRDELKSLSEAKVGNSDAYQMTQDKWMEKMYQAFDKVLDRDQWAKYQKSGAGRDKKARDKRAAKRK